MESRAARPFRPKGHRRLNSPSLEKKKKLEKKDAWSFVPTDRGLAAIRLFQKDCSPRNPDQWQAKTLSK